MLWVEDIKEVQNEHTEPMRLFERCQLDSKVSSPFGIAFRPTVGGNKAIPFPAWDYHPIYLPEFLKIQVADNTPLNEPMYFYLSFARRQDSVSIEKREPMEHSVPLKEVTSVKIYVLQDVNLSDSACILNQISNLSIIKSREHLIELEFDNGERNQSRDFRPDLPLIFKW